MTDAADCRERLVDLVRWWFGMAAPPTKLRHLETCDLRSIWEPIWFNKGADIDAAAARWADLLHSPEVYRWDLSAECDVVVLGLMVLWDQIPRNAYRNTPRAYDFDGFALSAARRLMQTPGVYAAGDSALACLLLTFVHDETLASQRTAVDLLQRLTRTDAWLVTTIRRICERHGFRVAEFGRIPERARIKGLPLTDRERSFLEAM